MADKIGEGALVAIKKQNTAVVQFKVPDIPKTRKFQKKILTEEQYVEELGKIIQKDFFPDLEKLQTQNEYLDAMQRNDTAKLREIYAKYSGRRPTIDQFGSESPSTFETPVRDTPSSSFSTPSSTSRRRKNPNPMSTTSMKAKAAPSDGHSLDSFLAAYTSEDDSSFQELIESADKKLRQKFAVLFDAEKETALAIAHSLQLPSIEDQFRAIEGPKTVDTWKYTNKNSIMYVPDGVELTKEEKLDLVNKKQEIEYGNTRLIHNPFNENQNKEAINELAKSQSKNNAGQYGIDGNALNHSNMPNVRGFSFVKTPSPHPGVAESPLMTWGELEGTPFRLDGSDTPFRPSFAGPSFHIAETSKRETIALALADKVGERMRDQKAKALEAARRNIGSPNIRSTLDRLATMSPAAKRLASSSIGIRDTLLTPSPKSISSSKSHTPSPLVRKKTPLIRTPNVHSSKSSLSTDDLLNIPLKTKK